MWFMVGFTTIYNVVHDVGFAVLAMVFSGVLVVFAVGFMLSFTMCFMMWFSGFRGGI